MDNKWHAKRAAKSNLKNNYLKGYIRWMIKKYI